jgi:hypothetical protein
MTRVHAVAHQAGALAKCGRERIEDIHGWVKPLGQSLIAAPRSIQLISFPFGLRVTLPCGQRPGVDAVRRRVARLGQGARAQRVMNTQQMY